MKRLRTQIAFFIASRLTLNTAYRMVYPFLPVFARALGVDLRTMSLALTARAASGALGPLLAPLTDRRGRRFGLSLGFGLFTAGAAVAYLGPGMAAFTAALVLMTLGKYVFDPAVLAHLGDLVPYERRGRALALTELSWALAFILGVPAAGFLIGRFGWRSPFLALACLGMAALVTVRAFFPRDRRTGPGPSDAAPGGPRPGHISNYRAVVGSPAALAALMVTLAAAMGNEVVNLVFGVWLEDSFGLKLAALGAASAVIGISEFGGEALVAATVDRLGKTKALSIGLCGSAAAALVLPLAGRTTATALAGLTLFYLAFEYTVGSIIPIMSEILPRARATLLAFNAAAFSLGRAAGSFVSPRLYGLGFPAVALAAVGLNIVAFLFLLRLRRLTAGKH
jgi:MFS transporter, DHA1 family, inner membrane transport protein